MSIQYSEDYIFLSIHIQAPYSGKILPCSFSLYDQSRSFGSGQATKRKDIFSKVFRRPRSRDSKEPELADHPEKLSKATISF